jgi:hypothetical protein
MGTIHNPQDLLANTGPLDPSPLSSITADDAADEEHPAVPEPFTVHDNKSANWLVRKVREARAYAQRVQEWAVSEIQRARRDEQFLLGRYGHQLQQWTQDEVHKLKGRRKSLNLPAGTVGSRLEPPRLLVRDEQALLDWCRSALPQAVKVAVQASGVEGQQLRAWQHTCCLQVKLTEEVVRDIVHDHAKATGEMPDGVVFTNPAERFFIR